jgi:predicted RNA-binding protein with PUA-like domain
MNYWLFKTEPDTFGVTDLEKSPRRTSGWDGVRNYQARNLLRDDVKVGDEVFIYHSSCAEPAIAGIARVVRAAYPDLTALDPKHVHYDAGSKPDAPRWYMVDVQLQRILKPPILLGDLRTHAMKKLRGMVLLQRGSRLSVMPVSSEHWRFILTLE